MLSFGRLFFLRQRMWDADPRATIELVQLLLEHHHWVLQCLGLRLCSQLLDADAPRYQLCFRELESFAVLLTRLLVLRRWSEVVDLGLSGWPLELIR